MIIDRQKIMQTAVFMIRLLATVFTFVVLFSISIAGQSYFDGDSRADFGVFRPSDGSWHRFLSETETTTTALLGSASESPVPADFDGDEITDIGVYRPSDGRWRILMSRDQHYLDIHWGGATEVPFGIVQDEPVPADYDGDGAADIAVWRPATGVWFVLTARTGFDPGQAEYIYWGLRGDIPVPADYDGDGCTDAAVFRYPENRWYVLESESGKMRTRVFGRAGYDMLVPADYSGDGRADLAVYRRGEWYIQDSATGQVDVFRYGLAGDVPVPADYSGDGVVDLGVFRRGVWYVFDVRHDSVTQFLFGTDGDIPVSGIVARPSIVGVH